MSTKRQLVSQSAAPLPQEGRSLPVDILLEVAARADAKTLVRVAATSKPLRRGILAGADFRRRLLAVHAAAAAADRLFDPSLLRGVSYTSATRHVDQAPPGLRVGIIDPDLLDEHGAPWSSRDGFLVLKCPSPDDVEPPKVCVCDALTGHVTCLPPMTLNPRRKHYTAALLSVDHGAGRAFELLVANRDLEFQTFSSKTDQWGPVRASSSQPAPRSSWLHSAHPAVVGCTVHWLIFVDLAFRQRILALDTDAGTATIMQLPEGYTVGRGSKAVVPVNFRGRLGVIVVESLGVSVWTTTTSASQAALAWNKQLVIRAQEIQWRTETDVDSFRALLVGGFGERSGVVVFQLKNGDLVRLDLGTKEVTVLSKGRQSISYVCLHETDLASLLQTMKEY